MLQPSGRYRAVCPAEFTRERSRQGKSQIGRIMQPWLRSSDQLDGGATMAVLHVRNVPAVLYERIRQRASAEGRSISAEVISLLERALQGQERSQAEILAGLRRRRVFRPAAVGVPDS